MTEVIGLVLGVIAVLLISIDQNIDFDYTMKVILLMCFYFLTRLMIVKVKEMKKNDES